MGEGGVMGWSEVERKGWSEVDRRGGGWSGGVRWKGRGGGGEVV